MARTRLDVVANGRKWNVKEGKTTVSSHLKKENAVDAAAKLGNHIKDKGGLAQVRIHKIDGKFQSERTYGKDPRKTPG
jgi:hypothetical protein